MEPEIMQLKIASLTNELHRMKRKEKLYQNIIAVIRKMDKYITPSMLWSELEYEMKFLDQVEREAGE